MPEGRLRNEKSKNNDENPEARLLRLSMPTYKKWPETELSLMNFDKRVASVTTTGSRCLPLQNWEASRFCN